MSVERVMGWEEIKLLVTENRENELGRLPEDLASYLRKMEEFRKVYHTVGDSIMNREFGYVLIEEGGLKRAVIPESKEKIVRFSINDYPYALENGIFHSLIWSTHSLTREEIIEICERNKPSELFDVLFFVNREEIKSVKNVYHAHVLWREKQLLMN